MSGWGLLVGSFRGLLVDMSVWSFRGLLVDMSVWSFRGFVSGVLWGLLVDMSVWSFRGFVGFVVSVVQNTKARHRGSICRQLGGGGSLKQLQPCQKIPENAIQSPEKFKCATMRHAET